MIIIMTIIIVVMMITIINVAHTLQAERAKNIDFLKIKCMLRILHTPKAAHYLTDSSARLQATS